jgi:hypothetical protein
MVYSQPFLVVSKLENQINASSCRRFIAVNRSYHTLLLLDIHTPQTRLWDTDGGGVDEVPAR